VRTEKRDLDGGSRGAVSAVFAFPDGRASETAVILAHGAGNDMHSPLLVAVQTGLARHGHSSVRFNFPYKQRGARAPDPAPVLETSYRRVVEQVRGEFGSSRLIIGGKSMGGRIASQIAAAGVEVDGLLFLGYPLHPAGRPDRLRVSHLARLRIPMLFFSGTRDPLCDLGLLRGALADLEAPVTLHVIENGDHSFRVPKRSGRTEDEVHQEIIWACAAWLRGLVR
jgi:predicted alpha/beta-hydrolase family hydrolase